MSRPIQLHADLAIDLAHEREASRYFETVYRPTAPACWLLVSAQRDGSFTVTNPRNNVSKTYGAVSSRCR
jgi:hypothetical protein